MLCSKKHIWGLDRTHYVYSHVMFTLINVTKVAQVKILVSQIKYNLVIKERAKKWKVPL